MIKIKAKIYKNGGSWVITIPKDFIKQGLIDPKKELELQVTEQNRE